MFFFSDIRASDIQSGTVSRFSSKLKGAIRGAIDGAPLEATEVPTVWDAFTDEPQVCTICFKFDIHLISSLFSVRKRVEI